VCRWLGLAAWVQAVLRLCGLFPILGPLLSFKYSLNATTVAKFRRCASAKKALRKNVTVPYIEKRRAMTDRRFLAACVAVHLGAAPRSFPLKTNPAGQSRSRAVRSFRIAHRGIFPCGNPGGCWKTSVRSNPVFLCATLWRTPAQNHVIQGMSGCPSPRRKIDRGCGARFVKRQGAHLRHPDRLKKSAVEPTKSSSELPYPKP